MEIINTENIEKGQRFIFAENNELKAIEIFNIDRINGRGIKLIFKTTDGASSFSKLFNDSNNPLKFEIHYLFKKQVEIQSDEDSDFMWILRHLTRIFDKYRISTQYSDKMIEIISIEKDLIIELGKLKQTLERVNPEKHAGVITTLNKLWQQKPPLSKTAEKKKSTDEEGKTVLHHLAIKQHGRKIKCRIEELIRLGRNNICDIKDNFENIALFYAVENGGNPKVVEPLVKHTSVDNLILVFKKICQLNNVLTLSQYSINPFHSIIKEIKSKKPLECHDLVIVFIIGLANCNDESSKFSYDFYHAVQNSDVISQTRLSINDIEKICVGIHDQSKRSIVINRLFHYIISFQPKDNKLISDMLEIGVDPYYIEPSIDGLCSTDDAIVLAIIKNNTEYLEMILDKKPTKDKTRLSSYLKFALEYKPRWDCAALLVRKYDTTITADHYLDITNFEANSDVIKFINDLNMTFSQDEIKKSLDNHLLRTSTSYYPTYCEDHTLKKMQNLLNLGASPSRILFLDGEGTHALHIPTSTWFTSDKPVLRRQAKLRSDLLYKYRKTSEVVEVACSLSWNDHYKFLFGKEPPQNNLTPQTKPEAIKKVLTDCAMLLSSPKDCLTLLIKIEETLRRDWKANFPNEPIPKMDESTYDIKVTDGIALPIPNKHYDKSDFGKKYSIISFVLLNMMREVRIALPLREKWTGFIPKEVSKERLRNNVFFTENRLDPISLLHGKYSHNLQRLLIGLAIRKNMIQTQFGDISVSRADVFSSLMDNNYKNQKTKDLPWVYLFDTRRLPFQTFCDPHCLQSYLMTSREARMKLSFLSDCLIHSFCNGVIAMAETFNRQQRIKEPETNDCSWTAGDVWEHLLSRLYTPSFFKLGKDEAKALLLSELSGKHLVISSGDRYCITQKGDITLRKPSDDDTESSEIKDISSCHRLM